ncbi:MAG: hypothetical protein COX43_02675 [Parcubacteria group bacterium CG23_combo_of_CG06-09_8_20_14_all_35_9]|nr:MAG: hypothetical protein COX43_02675 [Parcubacteria group bacterium CG23_combo_of_CG06-09_8_20_14_all_35_9]
MGKIFKNKTVDSPSTYIIDLREKGAFDTQTKPSRRSHIFHSAPIPREVRESAELTFIEVIRFFCFLIYKVFKGIKLILKGFINFFFLTRKYFLRTDGERKPVVISSKTLEETFFELSIVNFIQLAGLIFWGAFKAVKFILKIFVVSLHLLKIVLYWIFRFFLNFLRIGAKTIIDDIKILTETAHKILIRSFRKIFSGFRNLGVSVMRGIARGTKRFVSFAAEIKANFMKAGKEKALSSVSFFKPSPPRGWYKTIVLFAIILSLFILPIRAFTYFRQFENSQNKILEDAGGGYDHFKLGETAASHFNLDLAWEEFDKASQKFISAQEELNKYNFIILAFLRFIPQVASGEGLLEVGKDLSLAAKHLSKGMSLFIKDEKKREDISLSEKVVSFKKELVLALEEIREARNNLDKPPHLFIGGGGKINRNAIPFQYRENFEKIEEILPQTEKVLKGFVSASDVILEVLGHEHFKRYLFVFQNNTEMRPTGGFIGSIALCDIDKGEIRKLEIPGGGTYDLRAGLLEKISPPEPLLLVNPRWEMQDANWFPDWPASAQKIIWFYEKSGGASLDGVVSLTPQVIEELLALTGEIEMPEYGRVITSDNFLRETQEEAEKKYDETKVSKQFIADLAPKLIEKVFHSKGETLLDIFRVMDKNLKEKHILLYFTDSEIEKLILELNLGGEIKKVDQDYLSLINTNIGGGKTDGVIEEKIRHVGQILDDFSIIDTVTITRTHHGEKGDPFTGVKNVDYLRIYVPQGSVLLEAKGFEKRVPINPKEGYKSDLDLENIQGKVTLDEKSQTRINDEFGKTVFANWVETPVGESSVVTFKYRLPFKLAPLNDEDLMGLTDLDLLSYSLFVQKQAGSKGSKFRSNLKFPSRLELISYNPNPVRYKELSNEAKESFYFEGDDLIFEDKLNIDRDYRVIFKYERRPKKKLNQ